MTADELPVVRCRLLGPLRLEAARAALAVPGGVQRALLGALLLGGPGPLAAARLLDVVWGESARPRRSTRSCARRRPGRVPSTAAPTTTAPP
jgi:DNA-binding SARP family transcriptional activator